MSATQVALPFLASAITLSLGLYALHYRRRDGGLPLAIFLFVLSICALANGLETVLAEPQYKLWARHVATSVFWAYGVMVLWILLSIMPSRQRAGMARYFVLALPLGLAAVLTWTNAWHGWMWSQVSIAQSQLVKQFTPPGMALRWYALTLLAAIVVLGFLNSRRLAPTWRRHLRWLLFGASMPLWLAVSKMALPTGHLVQTFPTSIAFIPGAVAILIALWQHQLLGFGTIARDHLFNVLPDGLLVVDERCRVVDVNRTLHSLLRLPRDIGDCRAKHLLQRYPDWYEAVREQRDDRTLIRIAGRDYEVTVRTLDNKGRTHSLSTVRDVTETQGLLQRLEQQSQRDSLTGAHNRRAMMAFYDRMSVQNADAPVGMMVIDLDDFKQVNDRFGHQVGDDALILAVRLIQGNLRAGDLFCRMGGEEFVVVISGLTAATLLARAEAIRADLARNLVVADGYHVTASIGLANSPVPVPFEALFRVADERLYHSKHGGKNRVSGAQTGIGPVEADEGSQGVLGSF